MRLKHVVQNAGLVCASVLLVLGLLELGVRLLGNRLGGSIMPLSSKIHARSPVPGLGYELIPLSEVNQDDTWYRINEFGLRDREGSGKNPKKGIRIAAIGDSYTFGLGVPLEDTWVKQLERVLAARTIGCPVEVLNFGINGFDTEQEIILLERKVMGFKPDLIVWAYCLNDVGIFSREQSDINTFKGYDQFMTTGVAWLDEVLAKSRLYRLVKDRLYSRLYVPSGVFKALKTEYYSKDEKEVWRVGYEQHLINLYKSEVMQRTIQGRFERIARIVQRAKIPLLLVVLPDLEGLRPAESWIDPLIVSIARRSGLAATDCAFINAQPQDKIRVSKANLHLNGFGYRLMAEHIASYLQANKLLPGCP
jgi:hypothetical protein